MIIPTRSVLVVEDEALIRLILVDALRDAGLVVFEAANAAEALVILQGRSSIYLMFTDIDMPGAADGLALSQMVSERWPAVLIVITSGMRRPIQEDIPAGAEFVPKPYLPEQVARRFCVSIGTEL